MVSIARQFRIGESTVSVVIRECCDAIWKVLKGVVLPVPTTKRWLQIAEEFNDKWNYPLCIGAVDGKHVIITVRPIYLYVYVGDKIQGCHNFAQPNKTHQYKPETPVDFMKKTVGIIKNPVGFFIR